MHFMSKNTRQLDYRKKLIADGWRQKNFLLDPESLEILKANKAEHGSDAETVRAALKALPNPNKLG